MRAGGGADAGRGGDLPLLPPERRVRRQRLRLPLQGGGGALPRSRPDRADRGPPGASRPGRPEQLDDFAARARALMEELGAVLVEPVEGGKPGERRIRPAEWPDPAVRGRRHSRGRRRAPRPAHRWTAPSFSGRLAGAEARQRGRVGHGPADGDRRPDRGHGRGHPPAQRRHQRRDPRARREVPRPRPRDPDQRERVHRPGLRHRHGRPLSFRSSSSCTRTSCGWRPTSCSTRSPRPATCSAATCPCLWCCGRRSRSAPATGRSTRWTPPGSSPRRPAGGSSRRPRRSTTSV